MEGNEYVAGPFHLLRCARELVGMYLIEKVLQLGEMMDDAEDVWPEDD